MDKRRRADKRRRRRWKRGQLTGDQVAFLTSLAITSALWIAAVWKVLDWIL